MQRLRSMERSHKGKEVGDSDETESATCGVPTVNATSKLSQFGTQARSRLRKLSQAPACVLATAVPNLSLHSLEITDKM